MDTHLKAILLIVGGIVGLIAEIWMLIACVQHKLGMDVLDIDAAYYNQQYKTQLPVANATWLPLKVALWIMTPVVAGLLIAGWWTAAYNL